VPPPLPAAAHAGLNGGVPRASSMAVNTFTAPRCEIRRVVVHFYPDGIKGGAYPCEQQFFAAAASPSKRCALCRPSKPLRSPKPCRAKRAAPSR
jgi:hypothetical protein